MNEKEAMGLVPEQEVVDSMDDSADTNPRLGRAKDVLASTAIISRLAQVLTIALTIGILAIYFWTGSSGSWADLLTSFGLFGQILLFPIILIIASMPVFLDSAWRTSRDKESKKMFIMILLISVLTCYFVNIVYVGFIAGVVWLVGIYWWMIWIFTKIVLIYLARSFLGKMGRKAYWKNSPDQALLTELLDFFQGEISSIALIDSGFISISTNRVLIMNYRFLERLTKQEIIAIVMHEIGHLKDRKLGWVTSLQLFVDALSWFLSNFVVGAFFGMTLTTSNLLLYLPCVFLLASFLLIFLKIPVNFFLQQREYQADQYAASRGWGSFLASALKKCESIFLAATNRKDSGLPDFVLAHPSMEKRINRLTRK